MSLPAPDTTLTRLCSRAILVLTLLGLLFRIAQYASAHPIWHDEWMLLYNIQHKTAAQLLGPLEMNQGAPPLYLLSLRALYLTFGDSQLSLRLPALLGGCLSLLVFTSLARRLLGPSPGALLAVATFSLSDRMIWHSAEIKPYTLDTLFTLALLSLATRLPPRDATVHPSSFILHPFPLLSLTAAVGMWFSYPTLFTFAAILLALLIHTRRLLPLILTGLLPAASFLTVYFLCARHHQTPALRAAWTHEYVPWLDPATIPLWLPRRTLELCGYAAENLGPVFLLMAAIGAYAWCRRDAAPERRFHANLLLFPIAIILLAAAFWRYPYGGTRATLFLTPSIFLLAGADIEFSRAALSRLKSAAQKTGFTIHHLWPFPLLLVLGFMLPQDVYRLFKPRIRSSVLIPLTTFVDQHRQPDDAIYVASRDGHPAEFISLWNHRGGTLYPRDPDHPHPPPPANLDRLWFIAHSKDPAERARWLQELNLEARNLTPTPTRLDLKDGAAILLERAAAPDPSTPPSSQPQSRPAPEPG